MVINFKYFCQNILIANSANNLCMRCTDLHISLIKKYKFYSKFQSAMCILDTPNLRFHVSKSLSIHF